MLRILSSCVKIICVFLAIQNTSALMSQGLQTQLDGSDISILEYNRGIQGSPLIYDEFQDGVLIDNKGNEYKDLPLNYDALNAVLLYKSSEDTYIQLNKFMYVKARIGGDTYQNMASFRIPGFAKVLYDGEKIKCFEKVNAIKQTTDRQSYSQVTEKYKIVTSIETLLWVNGTMQSIKRRDKDFYELFSKEAVKDYVKKENIKMRDDSDLHAFLRHFEQFID